MNDETPPPIPQRPAVPSPPLTEPANMAPRWVAWLVASVVMPALPWLSVPRKGPDDGTGVFVLTFVALVLQLAASIVLAVGVCRRRAIGPGGAVGLTVLFLLASVAIGTAIWFAVCAARLATDLK